MEITRKILEAMGFNVGGWCSIKEDFEINTKKKYWNAWLVNSYLLGGEFQLTTMSPNYEDGYSIRGKTVKWLVKTLIKEAYETGVKNGKEDAKKEIRNIMQSFQRLLKDDKN